MTLESASDDKSRLLVERLSQAALSSSYTEQTGWMWKNWCTWAECNQLQASPAREIDILRYFHTEFICSQERTYSPGYPAKIACAIRLLHLQQGLSDPIGNNVRGYLSSLHRRFGPERPQQRMTPIRVDDAMRMVAHINERSQESEVFELALRLSRKMELPARLLRHVEIASIRPTATGFEISDPRPKRNVVTVDVHDDEVLTQLLRRVLGRSVSNTHLFRYFIAQQLQDIAQRAALEVAGDPFPGANLKPSEFESLIQWCDAKYAMKTRNTAYVLVGLAQGRRHDELRRYDIDDFSKAEDGRNWVSIIRQSKSDQMGRGVEHYLGHISDDDCPFACPACALERWLSLLEERWGYDSGPLFPGEVYWKKGITGRRMSITTGSYVLKAAWLSTGLTAEARIGTRSLRSGCATSAHEMGIPVTEIASDFTKHTDINMLMRYIITPNDPFSGQAHLPV